MPIPSGFEHLNRAGEQLASFAVRDAAGHLVRVNAPSRAEAERIARSDIRSPEPRGGEK